MSAVRTVLVVDDSAIVAKQLAKILEDSTRYRVIAHAADGWQALKEFKEHDPDIVCLDVAMPNLDGLQALRLIRHLKEDAKVVMITSVGGVADKVSECLRLGATNVVSKPFDAKQVLDVLDAI